MDGKSIASRLEDCERQIRTLRRAIAITTSLLAASSTLVLSAFGNTFRRGTAVAADSVRVHELIVLDTAGTVRARIGGNLPDAVINGRRAARGDNAAGVLLYDRSGTERGGYVTFDKSDVVGLTLDNHGNQAALFAAGPKPNEGAVARLWRQRDWAELRADDTGPRVSIGRSGAVSFIAPPMSDADAERMCSDLKAEVAQVTPPPPATAVLEACRAHAPNEVCRKCLGRP